MTAWKICYKYNIKIIFLMSFPPFIFSISIHLCFGKEWIQMSAKNRHYICFLFRVLTVLKCCFQHLAPSGIKRKSFRCGGKMRKALISGQQSVFKPGTSTLRPPETRFHLPLWKSLTREQMSHSSYENKHLPFKLLTFTFLMSLNCLCSTL